MKLSILDQSPISSNQTAGDALETSLKLAQMGDELGFARYWIAEHHNINGLACSAPEVMLPYIGAHTNNIVIGSGATLLPHYKPYKVAELFNMLATLFPGRIDLGIGRAPGGSAEATNALSDKFLQQVWKMPDLVKELLHYIRINVQQNHDCNDLLAAPIPPIPPTPWLLGTSKKSADLAAMYGIPYAFGQFMSDNDGPAIVRSYRENFIPNTYFEKPRIIVTVTAICAETADVAEDISLSPLIWSLQKEKGEQELGLPSIEYAKQYKLSDQERKKLKDMKKNMIIGDPYSVLGELKRIQLLYDADEIMIVTNTYSPDDRLRSYQLIGRELVGS